MSVATAPGPPAPGKSAHSHLPAILAIALVTHIVMAMFFFHFARIPALTSWGYENIAIALSLHHGLGFSSPFFTPSGPTAFMTPGYVFLIAAVIRLFGTGAVAAFVLIVFQIALSLLAIPLVMYVARRYFGVRTANLAGFVCAISEPLLIAPLRISDACLSALILTAALAVAPLLGRNRSYFAAAGVGCAIAILINPALLFALLAIFAWSAWRTRTIPWLGILLFLAVYAPWPIRNAVVMHSEIPFRSNFGYELWLGNQPGGDGESAESQNAMLSVEQRRLFIAQGELNFMHQKGALAKTYIAAHPAEFAKLTAKRFVRFWAGGSKEAGPMTALLALLGLTGLALLWRRKSLFALFGLPLIIYPLPYYITHADARYQFVLDPLLAILAAHAIELFLQALAPKPALLAASTAAAVPAPQLAD